MNWFSGLLSSILTRRKSVDNGKNVIEYPVLWKAIIFVAALVFLVTSIIVIFLPNIFADTDTKIFVISVSLLLTVALIYFFLYLLFWKVEVFDSYFLHSRAFRSKTKIAYDNIELRGSSSGHRFYIDNKHILSVSYLQDNYRLLDKAIRKYQKDNKIRITKKVTNVLKPIQGLWFLPFVSLIIISIPTISIYLEEGLINNFYISLPFHLITIYLFLFMFNWKISFENSSLTKKSTFGYKKVYDMKYISYKTLEGSLHPDDTRLYFQNKKIAFIMGNVNNLRELIEAIDNEKK